jgi:DNA-binding XRE family transcriptional regulator
MSGNCINRYKLCRETAHFTQEHAAELLHISPRTLSDYENGHTKVPDDIVDAMATHYKCPLLAWWHLKTHSILGKYLPDVVMPSTVGDMALQVVFAQDDLASTVEISKQFAKQIMLTGKWCEKSKKDLRNTMEVWRQVKTNLMSAIVYAKQVIDE